MTTLNTIIEEENRALEKKIGTFTFNNGGALELTLWDIVEERVHETDEVGTVINDHLTTAMQRAYKAGREERDTYWKERVQKIYLKILKKARKTDYADTTEYDECAELLKPLLDNLK